MSEPRVALLNAAHEAEETRRNFERELDVALDVFHSPSGEFPENLQYDGVVITGSSASVYWDREWIGRLKMWVGDAVQADIPTLGVCFGHQLLADILGGRVASMGEYELGYRTVEQDEENYLLAGLDESLTVFTSHSDHVVNAPPGATVFAKNDYGIHGFQKQEAFGIQFHPEYDMEMARTVTEGKTGDVPEDRIDAVLDQIHRENYREACKAKQTFSKFLDYALSTRT